MLSHVSVVPETAKSYAALDQQGVSIGRRIHVTLRNAVVESNREEV